MLSKLFTAFFGSKQTHDLKLMLPVLARINTFETWAINLEDSRFPLQTEEFRKRLRAGESLDSILPEVFALVREASRRRLGERNYDVQLLGAIVLHQGKIMEMKTGEGKTLSSVAAAYLNALPGKGVHIVTVNDYLAERDADWMRPVYDLLGISVGAILSRMDNEARKVAYNCDITYGTNNEFGFDYLRDNMRHVAGEKVQKNHHYCIIDEIDSILIDEARTPLIISGQAEDDTVKFTAVNRLVGQLRECDKDPATGTYPEDPVGDYKIDEKSKRITFTDAGMNSVESLLLSNKIISGSLFDDENFEYIHYMTQAMKAHKLFHRDTDYVVQDGKVEIVDEFTGRVLTGRRYSEGLHQAIEAKERIQVARRNRTLATITYQNFFRMYDKISGMTGTADTEAKEFTRIYGLDVVVIPSNRPLARKDQDDVIYFDAPLKYNAICDEIDRANKKGQPILVGTVSIEKSEILSKYLTKRNIRHEVLNAKNHSREALIISEAGAKGSVTIATNMAGRGTDIKLGGNPEYRARKKAGTEASAEEYAHAFQEEYAKWQNDYREVKELGGLYILGTERHESRRIDNQLRGRSGRQGDPGESRFFLSLDDDLMRLFANENMKNMMGRLGMKGGEPIFHPWINKSIEKAQTRVEERNFEIRKHLLEFDDVLNEQRNFIYSQRDAILEDNDLSKRILNTLRDILEETIEQFEGQELIDSLREEFLYSTDMSPEEISAIPKQELVASIFTFFEKDIAEKENTVTKDQLNDFIRFEYLKHIDMRWQDHLENLESLREAVYLRSYGQKNPLLEYKLEGFEIFDTLIYEIRSSIAKKIIKIRIRKVDESERRRMYSPSRIQESHGNFGQFGNAGAEPSKVQVQRTMPKVGRNDPCPCGSGKKYKHCHGQ